METNRAKKNRNLDLNAYLIISRKMYFSCGSSSDKSPYGEGFNYTLQVFIRGKPSKTGLIVSFHDVDKLLHQVVNQIKDKHLSFDLPYFNGFKSSEILKKLTQFCYEEFKKYVFWKNAKIYKLRLVQGEDRWMDVWPH